MSDAPPIDLSRCSRCGGALSGPAGGLCVRCLLAGALTPPEEEVEAAEALASPATLLARRQFASYELLGEIARGGMGVVFRARQSRPERTVALKVIAAGELATPRMVERFRTEASAAARLDHPNIVPIYEVGHHDGWHFFSMRLIQGGTLADKLRSGPLPPAEAARLMIKNARAVQHAHERGVLHRDLKPNNILLDERGEPHLTDFGLAKMVESSVEMTLSNVALGTPAYMAPEQAAGGTRDVTVSVDVYGLGAVLYEMLTGRPPFEAANLHALMRKVAEDEPVAPSARLAKKSKQYSVISESVSGPRAALDAGTERRTPCGSMMQEQDRAAKIAALPLITDLDAICLKCLEKEPALRYPSAEAFAADLERALRGETIVARPSTRTQRVRKWVRRNPAKAGLLATAASLLVIGSAVSTWQAVRATRAEGEQKVLRRQAEAQTYAADINLAQQSLALNNIGRARDLLLRHAPAWERRLPAGESVPVSNNTPAGSRRSQAPRSQTDLRGWEWRYLWQQAQSDADYELAQLPHSITSVSVSHNARWLAVGQIDGGGLVVFDLRDRAEVFRAESKFHRVNTAFSPRESLLAFTLADGPSREQKRHWIRLWSAETREIVGDIPTPVRCDRLRFSEDGQTLLATVGDQLMLWRVSDRTRLSSFPADSAISWALDASSDFSRVATPLEGGRLRLVDLRSSNVLWTVKAANEYVTAVAISPDRSVVASGAGFAETSIRLWVANSGRELGRLDGHAGYVHQLHFLPDSKTLISASSDQTIRLWDIASRSEIAVLRGHSQEVWSQVLLPDQRTLVSGAKDGSVMVWDIERARRTRGRITLPAPARGWAFGPGGKTILLGENTGVVSEWSGPDFKERRVLHDFGTNLIRTSFTSDGGRIAVQFPDRRAVIRDLTNSRTLAEYTLPPGRAELEEFSADGSRLFVNNSTAGEFYEWNVVSNRVAQTWRPAGQGNIPGAPSHDGRWCVVLNSAGEGIARDLIAQTNRPARIEIIEPDAAAFSPDDRLLAVTSLRGFLRLYEWPSLREAGTLPGFLQGVHSVRFSPDGRRVAAGSNGRQAIKLWDVVTQRELVTLEGSGSIFSRIRFSPDGNIIGARSAIGIVHLWRAPSMEEISAAAK